MRRLSWWSDSLGGGSSSRGRASRNRGAHVFGGRDDDPQLPVDLRQMDQMLPQEGADVHICVESGSYT